MAAKEHVGVVVCLTVAVGRFFHIMQPRLSCGYGITLLGLVEEDANRQGSRRKGGFVDAWQWSIALCYFQ
jgi:hypothetical protein